MVINAIKFTFEGGIRVQVTYDHNFQMILFSVMDTGIGIPSDKRDSIFEMFSHLEKTLTKNTTGMGVGLNVCKNIIEALGGQIWLDQTYSNGSHFLFKIEAKDIDNQTTSS